MNGMTFDLRAGSFHISRATRMRVCVTLCAYDEVFCLHTPSRVRHSHMSVRVGKTTKFQQFLHKKNFEKRQWSALLVLPFSLLWFVPFS